MIVPARKLSKRELVWLAEHKCLEHNHAYIGHYDCYLRDYSQPNYRVGYFDIETSHLKATFGKILTYCILDDETGQIYSRTITRAEAIDHRIGDKYVVDALLDHLKMFNAIVTYYGSRFDVPFCRTRATIHGWRNRFPVYNSKTHIDVYWMVRNRFSLHSNRLEVACDTLLGSTNKTSLRPAVWIKAGLGNRAALDYIYDHCVHDVKDLKRLYRHIEPFSAYRKTSI